MTTHTPLRSDAPIHTGHAPATFGHTLRAEWIKFTSVRSTLWTLTALFVLGAGLTGLITLLSADWLASGEADEPVGAFVTWGMYVAQIAAIVLGTLAVTSEYGTSMMRSTLAATPRRSQVLAAKAVVVGGVLAVTGTVTAFAGYGLAKLALMTVDIGVSLSDEGFLRAMFGSGLYLAALGLFALAVGFLVRHTAAALAIVLGVVFVVSGMTLMLPGTWGEWVMKLTPGNVGLSVAVPVDFNPFVLSAWPSFGVFAAQTAALLLVAYLVFRRRDA